MEKDVVKISEEVINKIAFTAATEVEGVLKIAQKKANNRKIFGTKNNKGIYYESSENGLTFFIYVTVKYGSNIPDICEKVQANVTESITNMTGLTVEKVNIAVVGVEQ